MRLIDADSLLEHLEDFALQESPIFAEDDVKVYEAIKQCIAAVNQQATLKPKIAKIDGRLKVRLVRTYEKHCAEESE